MESEPSQKKETRIYDTKEKRKAIVWKKGDVVNFHNKPLDQNLIEGYTILLQPVHVQRKWVTWKNDLRNV